VKETGLTSKARVRGGKEKRRGKGEGRVSPPKIKPELHPCL